MKILESKFPPDYREEEIAKILSFIQAGKFCQLICIPGAGKATVLRLLAHNRTLLKHHLGQKEASIRFVYMNFFELPNFEETQITKFILIALEIKPLETEDSLILRKQLTEAVNKLADLGQTIVFLFDHFDEHQNHLSHAFFQLLRSLRSIAKYKFAVLFATRRDLAELVDEEIARDYWDFFVDNAVYLKISNVTATNYLFSQIEEVFDKRLSKDQKTKITSLCAGHAKLTKIISELVLSQDVNLEKESLLQNRQVQASLYEIWLFLTSEEQNDLHLIANAKDPKDNSVVEKLIKFDIIDDKKHFTIPLFEEFIKTVTPQVNQQISYNPQTNQIQKGDNDISELLSPQEYRLLKFLIQNKDKILGRDEIIKAVWPNTQVNEAISDEAIDQMVFRLRKKIEDRPAEPKHIQTIKGLGLKFES